MTFPGSDQAGLAVTSLYSVRNSVCGQIEQWCYQRRLQEATIRPPVFILGIFRSGTTYLHDLMSTDTRFAYPNTYQIRCPHQFLTFERFNRFVPNLNPETRPQGNVRLGAAKPDEEEAALCSLIGRSFMLDLVFPRQAAFYRRYYTLTDLSDAERQEWQKALNYFLRKLSFKYERPLLLKSPAHTCRIRYLRELFPEAKFVHILRNPYDVFQSWCRTVEKLSPWWNLQIEDLTIQNDVLEHYQLVYDKFLKDRDSIPDRQFAETRYEKLVQDPLCELARIYDELQLPDFDDVRPRLESRLGADPPYRTNQYPALAEETRSRIQREWSRFFEAWDYPLVP